MTSTSALGKKRPNDNLVVSDGDFLTTTTTSASPLSKRSKVNDDDSNPPPPERQQVLFVQPSLLSPKKHSTTTPPSLPSVSPAPFYKCHLWMLKSLYTTHQNQNDPHNHMVVEPQEPHLQLLWNQIEQYLTRLQSLQSNNAKLIQLSELVHESKCISQQQPPSSHHRHAPPHRIPPAPLQRMNTHLKSESKLSFSFVTQSQQSKVTSLSLNSPCCTTTTTTTMMGIQKVLDTNSSSSRMTSPPYMYHGTYYSNKDNKTKRIVGSSSSTCMSMRKRNVHDPGIMLVDTNIHSMNLVTSMLLERYKAQVQLTIEEREPFLPLLMSVEKQIINVGKEIEEMNGNGIGKEEEGCDLQHMSRDEIWTLLLDTDIANRGKDGNPNSCCYTTQKSLEQLSLKKCQLSLWKALEASLKSVICVVPNMDGFSDI